MLSSSVTVQSRRFTRLSALGEGTFGTLATVWDAELLTTRALKTFKPEGEDVAECALREIAYQAFLTDLSAPNLLPFLDVLVSAGPEVCMLQPLMRSDLAAVIDGGAYAEWETALAVLGDVLDALRFLHSFRPAMVHRDLKPENILVEPTGRAVLTDLGFMRFTKDQPPYDSGPFCHGSNQRATRTYSAPEMLRHGVPHGPGVDIWASGVVGAELHGKRRLQARTDRAARRHLLAFRATHAQNASMTFLCGMLEPEPSARIQAAEALRHEVFNSPSFPKRAETPASVSIERPEPCLSPVVADRVAELMTELDFHCCQTFYAACAYAAEALQWRGGDAQRASDVTLYSVLTASKLYEHEYWDTGTLAKTLELEPVDFVRNFVSFQKLLLQNRKGRLLVPFPSTCCEFEKRLVPKATRRRRRGRKGAAAQTLSTTSAAPEGGSELAATSPPEAEEVASRPSSPAAARGRVSDAPESLLLASSLQSLAVLGEEQPAVASCPGRGAACGR